MNRLSGDGRGNLVVAAADNREAGQRTCPPRPDPGQDFLPQIVEDKIRSGARSEFGECRPATCRLQERWIDPPRNRERPEFVVIEHQVGLAHPDELPAGRETRGRNRHRRTRGQDEMPISGQIGQQCCQQCRTTRLVGDLMDIVEHQAHLFWRLRPYSVANGIDPGRYFQAETPAPGRRRDDRPTHRQTRRTARHHGLCRPAHRRQ